MRRIHFCAIVFSCLLLFSCGEPEPLKIGFIGSLSGRAAEVSQSVRDGAILAVEEINAQGGINKQRIEMVIFDDQHDQAKAREGVNFLADAGVAVIIGPVTSQMAVAATPAANTRKIALVSPTSSTMELTGVKDYFFRTIPACEVNARRLAKHAITELGAQRYAILNDQSNKAFTDAWQDSFSDQASSMGAEIVTGVTYNSLEKSLSFLEMAEQILVHDPEAILILSNSIDAALFCQQVSKLTESKKIFLGSDWSFSGNLVQYGGGSVEGFTFTTSVDMHDDTPSFTKFTGNFTKRFGVVPRFPSVLAYDATQTIARALAIDSDPANMPETMVTIGKVDVLQGTLQLDSFGDVDRATYVNTVQNGRFTSLKKVD